MPDSTTKSCPYCAEAILATARKCRYCGEMLDESDEGPRTNEQLRMILPVDTPLSALASGYCALFGIVPVFGLPFSIAALVCGLIALKAIRQNPELAGKGRATFGIALGSVMTVVSLGMLLLLLIGLAMGPGR